MAIAEEAEETDEDGAVGSTAAGSSTDTGTDEGTTTDTADDGRYTRKRCVLITGCSSGIGRATARTFLQNEWLVVATSRDPEDIADLDELGCETLALDVTDPEQVASVVERTVDLGGAIDCLVNNAGYGQMGPLEDVSTAELHRQFDVNVYGPHRLTRAALPHMRAQGEGRIVNVSSVLGRMAFAGTGAYSGAKHALEAMSDALRAEAEEFGVEVVLVEPGTVETEFTERVDDELPPEETRTPAYESLYEMIEEARLIGGSGPLAISPEEVAAAILYAGTCPEPPARYPVGPLAEYGMYVRYLPDSLRDAAYGLFRRLV